MFAECFARSMRVVADESANALVADESANALVARLTQFSFHEGTFLSGRSV